MSVPSSESYAVARSFCRTAVDEGLLSEAEAEEALNAKIELDESRHLAMDYWLVERAGEKRGFLRAGPIEVALSSFRLRTIALSLVGYTRMLYVLDIPEEGRRTYWRRVQRIQEKAPHSRRVPALRNSIRLLKTLNRRRAVA